MSRITREQTFKNNIKIALRGLWKLTEIETRTENFVSDWAYTVGPQDSTGMPGGISGWIEVKALPKWPKNPESPVKVPHPERVGGQVRFALGVQKFQGQSWFLVQIDEDILLISPAVMKMFALGKSPKEEWFRLCRLRYASMDHFRKNNREFFNALSGF